MRGRGDEVMSRAVGRWVPGFRRLAFALLLLSAALGTHPHADTPAYGVLHNFLGPEGSSPQSGLTLKADGTIFGTTCTGGTFGDGSIFRVDLPSTVTTIHSFHASVDGACPASELLAIGD